MNNFNIVSIDPGNNIGISIYTINSLDLSIVNIETRLLILNNFLENDIDKMLTRLMVINNIIKDIHTIYNPLCIGLETSFLNLRFPKAVMQLSQYVGIIEFTSRDINPKCKFFRYMPKFIKSEIMAGGGADKNDMTKAVNNIKEITTFVNPLLLSEHEVDSLAIGYTMLIEIRKYPFILYAL